MNAGTMAIWVDGVRQLSDAPHLSALDRGFLLGDGAFETMRAHRGQVFRLPQHLGRLHRGLDALAIRIPQDLEAWIARALGEVAWADTALRLSVSRGLSDGSIASPREPGRQTVVVAAWPLPVQDGRVRETGLSARIVSGRRNERGMTVGLKILSYADNVMALIEAGRAGADDALVLDTEGHCCEGAFSNLFICRAGTLVTPPASCGALPGITRQAVLECASGLGLPTVERPFFPAELLAADEAFLTSSLRGIAPLVAVDRQAIGSGAPGPVTARIRDAYAGLVMRECGVAPTS